MTGKPQAPKPRKPKNKAKSQNTQTDTSPKQSAPDRAEDTKPRRKTGAGRPTLQAIETGKKIAALYADPHKNPTPAQIIQLNPPRQVGYSEPLMESILAHIAIGKSVRDVAKMQGMPDFPTIYRWIDSQEKWQERYKIATQHRARAHVEEAEHQLTNMLADDDPRRSLLYDARIRSLTRMAALGDPMRYSEKMLHLHHHSGELAVKLEFDLGQKDGVKEISGGKIADISDISE